MPIISGICTAYVPLTSTQKYIRSCAPCGGGGFPVEWLTCPMPQFSALLDAGLLRDMLSLYDGRARQYHAIAALGDSVCGHR